MYLVNYLPPKILNNGNFEEKNEHHQQVGSKENLRANYYLTLMLPWI